MLYFLISVVFLFIFILIAVAYFTHAERKILGATQRRRGPNVIGVYGLLQPLSDGLKLMTKEPVLPSSSDKIMFIIAPILTFLTSLISWVVIPFSKTSFLTEIELS
jgi:NADH-quinone oxidoreductase subunit H